MTADEDRAAQYLRDQAAGRKARRAREKALRGDKAARKALEDRWAPLRGWMAER